MVNTFTELQTTHKHVLNDIDVYSTWIWLYPRLADLSQEKLKRLLLPLRHSVECCLVCIIRAQFVCDWCHFSSMVLVDSCGVACGRFAGTGIGPIVEGGVATSS